MSSLKELTKLGQSVWYDYIRRAFVSQGELEALVRDGLRGVTSNPSIFDKAIAGSADYDAAIKQRVEEGKTIEEIYEELAIEDIQQAADILEPVYDETEGADGYVSLEVNPTLANNKSETLAEAQRLFKAVARPNVMIKVPATPAGIPVITELIALGINVNVTLIFSVENYAEVADAYLAGLEKRTQKNGNLSRVASVASFFVSRVDHAVDRKLLEAGHPELVGKIAIANAKLAYRKFQEIFSGKRWEELKAKGARVQRPLWASTSTKNPEFPDTLYVDELIAPDTVNTMPPATLNAFLDHGTVKVTLTKQVDLAEEQLASLTKTGIDLHEITQQLQDDGVAAFAKSFDSLLASLADKKERLLAESKGHQAQLGTYGQRVEAALKDMRHHKIMNRIWAHDHTVWKDDPAEISNRLGWLHSPDTMPDAVPEIAAFVERARADGFTHALLLGMGGSSLAPEVFRKTFGVRRGYLDLSVLDSTDPAAVKHYDEAHDPEKTLYLVSTKSGGTIETLSFFKYFYNRVIAKVGKQRAGKHFVAITDPGSGLAELAGEYRFRKTFLNDPNIGGRYSALSFFGLVPAALIGVDLEKLLERAGVMVCNNEGCNCPVAGDNTGAWLGAIMGELAKQGRDKLTFVLSPKILAFGAWIEQLIAESTGKEEKGILPIASEPLGAPDEYSDDRLFAYLRLQDDSTFDAPIESLEAAGFPVIRLELRDLYDLGGEFFRWEMATAVAGHLLGINPFDQPNVESAKNRAREMVAAYQSKGELPTLRPNLIANGLTVFAHVDGHSLKAIVRNFLSQAKEGEGGLRSYISLQAYLNPVQETEAALERLATELRRRYKLATTVGFGPRFLHSTGQLHKGDAGNGLFIQLTANMPDDLPIPDDPGSDESAISFGVLKMAQALGDRKALLDNRRKVLRIDFGNDILQGIDKIQEII